MLKPPYPHPIERKGSFSLTRASLRGAWSTQAGTQNVGAPVPFLLRRDGESGPCLNLLPLVSREHLSPTHPPAPGPLLPQLPSFPSSFHLGKIAPSSSSACTGHLPPPFLLRPWKTDLFAKQTPWSYLFIWRVFLQQAEKLPQMSRC